MEISVVAPAFNEAPVLPAFIRRTTRVLDDLGVEAELILVDDGSTDETWEIILAASERDSRVHGVRLARNFGHQLALTAGLAAADGDGVVTLDSDLQHPPEVIRDLVAVAAEGWDVVHAVRSTEDDAGLVKRLPAKAFYFLLGRLSTLELPEGAADFRYMSRRVVNVLIAMPERHRFLRGMTRWVGYRQTVVTYRRAHRGAGRSKYSLGRMILLAWDAVTSFSAVPLRAAGILGVAVSLLGFAYLAYAIAAHAFTETTISGWTSVTAAVLVLGGVQLICLGIFGQYLGRMYEDIKGRPLFLVAEDTRGVAADDPLQGLRPSVRI